VVELHRSLKKLADSERQAVMAQVTSEHGDPGARERIMLSWDEIREMQESGLITIGAHTLSHPILTRMPPAGALTEIRDSKLFVEQKVGRPVEFFAYPNGGWSDFDAGIIAMVRECGFKAACSTISAEHFNETDRYRLPRTDITENICRAVGGGFSLPMFSVKVSGMLDGILF
jgi:peptidoglycan/xylan/chitin deacetylase (PgdA/CDA1 family)